MCAERSRPDLRLIVITDRRLAAPRSLDEVLRAALEAGAPAVQLRDKTRDTVSLYEEAVRLRELTRRHGALLFINDRFDVALAAGADGVHLGPHDLPVAAVRRAAPPGFIIGCSADDPATALAALAAGADYIGCGAVFGTLSKEEIRHERIGVAGLAAVVRSVNAPVIAIGGVSVRTVTEAATAGASGCAVIRAIMTAPEPGAVTEQLLAPFRQRAR